MIRKMLVCLLAVFCLGSVCIPGFAAEVDCDSVYCFSQEDFSPETSFLGICVTALPGDGAVMLGTRVVQPGDILTASQVTRMTFAPVRSREDKSAELTYLPVFADHVGETAVMTIRIRGKEDKAPVAEDMALETYKNLPNKGSLKVSDPEGQPMTFTITRQPKRGDVTIQEDGSFTYTPKKNKVGVDSFAYTAADPAGNVSREATVVITILKPSTATCYGDTEGRDCRFAAEWMKNSGIFLGEQVAGNRCFQPDKQVTRGEFVTMLVKALDIPVEEALAATGYTDEVPLWLQPYLAAAVRAGLTAGLPEQQTFGEGEPITGGEVAVLLKNALSLTAQQETMTEAEVAVPVWAQGAVAALEQQGLSVTAENPVTREEAAQLIYQASRLHRKITE